IRARRTVRISTRGTPPAGRPLHATTEEPTTSPRCDGPLGYWKPHQLDRCAPPTSATLPEGVGLPFTSPHTDGQSARLPGSHHAPIRSNTDRDSLRPSSSARSPIGSPWGSLSLAGERRAYHLPRWLPRGLGCVSRPVARHLRQGTVEPRYLATTVWSQPI